MMNYTREAIVLLFLICGSLLPAQDLDLARTKYELAVETAGSEYQQSKVKLLGFYDQALDGISRKAQRAGNLDGVTECRRERQRVEDDVFVTLDAGEGVDPAILNLRKKLSAGMRDIELKRKTQLSSLYENFARGANQMIVRLTKQSEIEKARDLKAMKEKFEREFTATIGANKAKKGSIPENGDFEDGLAGWEFKDAVTSKSEVSLGTGRSQKFVRITANPDRNNEIFIPRPKKIDPRVSYRLTFRYRVSPDYKTVAIYDTRPPPRDSIAVGTSEVNGSSGYSSIGVTAEVADGKWHEYKGFMSFQAPDSKMKIGTLRATGHIDLDDIKLAPR